MTRFPAGETPIHSPFLRPRSEKGGAEQGEVCGRSLPRRLLGDGAYRDLILVEGNGGHAEVPLHRAKDGVGLDLEARGVRLREDIAVRIVRGDRHTEIGEAGEALNAEFVDVISVRRPGLE